MGKETYGIRHTRIYNILNGMEIRCYDKNNYNHSKYGQKEIKVCDEWSINNSYTDNLTLDRINTPKNSNLKLLNYNNETHTLIELGRITGIKIKTISQRLKYGWDIEKALTVSPEVYKNRKSKRR